MTEEIGQNLSVERPGQFHDPLCRHLLRTYIARVRDPFGSKLRERIPTVSLRLYLCDYRDACGKDILYPQYC